MMAGFGAEPSPAIIRPYTFADNAQAGAFTCDLDLRG